MEGPVDHDSRVVEHILAKVQHLDSEQYLAAGNVLSASVAHRNVRELVLRPAWAAACAAGRKGAWIVAPDDAQRAFETGSPVEDSNWTNRYLVLAHVLAAKLHRGLSTDRLNLVMESGRTHKLLWLGVDPAHHLLLEKLPAVLGDRFTED